MKLEEKLIKLRKEKGFSQEDLAEKLNVTRQTISKWELGQSKPDLEKTMEISKLFDIGVEKLTDDAIDLEEDIKKVKSTNGTKTIIIVVAVIIGILLLARLLVTIFAFNTFKKMTGIEDFSPSSFIQMFFGFANEAEEKFEDQKQQMQEEHNSRSEKIIQNYNNRVEQMQEEYSDGIQQSGEHTNEWFDQQLQQMPDTFNQLNKMLKNMEE